MRARHFGWVLAVAAAAGWSSPQSDRAGQVEPEMSSSSVAKRGTATVEDAYRQFLAMASRQGRVQIAGEVDDLSFDAMTKQLESLCMIDPEWSFAPNVCLRRDVLAYMTCSYLGCRPGILTGLCGMTRRYAHREMVYKRIVPAGPPATPVSGSELLSVLTNVSRRVESHRDVQLTRDEIH